MDFSYFCNATNWSSKPYGEVLNDIREIAQYLDEQESWKTIWFSEHHLQTTQGGDVT